LLFIESISCVYSIKMPESGAVYQPTTVGYAYDTRDGSRFGIGSSFSRIMSRHKFNTKSWLEWILFSVAVAAFIAGLTTMLVNLVSPDSEMNTQQKVLIFNYNYLLKDNNKFCLLIK
jgi:hypothetical protein